MKRELVPGRWQMAVEGLTGFIDDMVKVNIGPEGKKFMPYIFSLFMFILVANLLGLLPLAIVPGLHALHDDEPLQHHRRAGVLSFSIVLIVGFWRTACTSSRCSFRTERPSVMVPLIVADRVRLVHGAPVQPRAATVRRDDRRAHPDGSVRKLHRQRLQRRPVGFGVGDPQLPVHRRRGALELLVCAIQAYVFALLTTLYLNDAINLH